MRYILNSSAKIKQVVDGNISPLPHLWDMTMGKWLARELTSRVSTEDPELEYRIATELEATDSFEATPEELEYIRTIIIGMKQDSMGIYIDNLFKSQVLACLK